MKATNREDHTHMEKIYWCGKGACRWDYILQSHGTIKANDIDKQDLYLLPVNKIKEAVQ